MVCSIHVELLLGHYHHDDCWIWWFSPDYIQRRIYCLAHLVFQLYCPRLQHIVNWKHHFNHQIFPGWIRCKVGSFQKNGWTEFCRSLTQNQDSRLFEGRNCNQVKVWIQSTNLTRKQSSLTFTQVIHHGLKWQNLWISAFFQRPSNNHLNKFSWKF